MFPSSGILVGIFAGFASLYFLRRYCAGTSCTINKDLSNHIAVVTGGNTGIGKETVKKISELGCKVIIGARDVEKNKKTVQQMSANKGKVVAFRLDLGDKDSIQNFVKDVKKQIGDHPLNYLVNNAGMMAIPQKRTTKQGIEMQIGVNHFGHFYLTYLLWDSLKKAGNPRIINVSSRAHKSRGDNFDIDFQDINYQKSQYGGFQAYSRSKKANILFTNELQRKMNEAKINGSSFSLHPGVVRTELSRQMLNSSWKRAVYSALSPMMYIIMKSPQEGAQTTIYTLLEREDKLKGGQYYSDCSPSPLLASQCSSQQAAKKLWQESEKAWNIKFEM